MQRPTNVRYIVLIGLCLMAGIAYVQRGCLGPVETTVRSDLHLTTSQTGQATEIFFLTYALFQIPTGLLVDRWGARRTLLLFGSMSAVTLAIGAGSLWVGATLGYYLLVVSRALMGVAQAGLFPSATRCFANWFPIRRRAFATGFFQACMSIGAALGASVASLFLMINVPWPWIFLIFSAPGIIWSLWFFGWYRDRPEEHRSTNQAERDLLKPPPEDETAKESDGPTPWLKLATRPKLIWLCLSQFFRASANVFWMAWCATFLQEVYRLDKGIAGHLSSIPFLGVVLGSLGGGLLADWVLARTGSKRMSRNGVAIGTAIVGVGFFLSAYFVQQGPYVAIALLFLAAIFSSGANACAYSVTMDIGGRYMAVVFGAMNMSGNLGAFLFPKRLFLPWADEFGWIAAPLLMALLYSMGVICWWFVNPNGKILDEK